MKTEMKTIKVMRYITTGLFIAFMNCVWAQNSYEVLEREYNHNGELFYVQPGKSWNKASVNALPEILKNVYNINESFKLDLLEETIENGSTFSKYVQTINSIPVTGGDIIIKRNSGGEIEHIIGTLHNIMIIPSMVIGPEQAIERAISYLGKDLSYLWLSTTFENHFKRTSGDPSATYFPKPELCYAEQGGLSKTNYVLCYEIRLPTAEPAEHLVYINALTGETEYAYNDMHTVAGQGIALYRGNVNITTAKINNTKYYLEDSTRNIYNWDWRGVALWRNPDVYYFQDDNNNYSDNNEKAAVATHYGMAKSLDY